MKNKLDIVGKCLLMAKIDLFTIQPKIGGAKD